MTRVEEAMAERDRRLLDALDEFLEQRITILREFEDEVNQIHAEEACAKDGHMPASVNLFHKTEHRGRAYEWTSCGRCRATIEGEAPDGHA